MRKSSALVKTGIMSLVFTLLLMVLSPGIVEVSGQEFFLTVDIWTDRGGQGEELTGGTYKVGEEWTIYVRVNTRCQIRWVLSGPFGGDSGEGVVDPGVHRLLRRVAEEADVGQWEVFLDAWTEEEYIIDAISFTIEAGVVPLEPDKDKVVSLPGADILTDNFDLENEGRGQLNYFGFTNWEVTKGSVDLIGHGVWDYFPDHGLYLDLDGSSNNAGRLESKTTFRLEPGQYRLEFDLAGSPSSGPNTVTASLGSLYREDFTLGVKDPFRTITRMISVSTSTSTKLIFDHAGEDNQGLFLDNVKLTKLSAEVPEEGVAVLDLSEANEAWAREWKVLSTAIDFRGGKAGFYPEAERSGHANPNPGREGILYLHPQTSEKPARISRRVKLTEPRPTLKMGVSGNRDVDGDWALVVKVNGEPLEKERIIAGAQGWQDLTFDLSTYSGETVAIEIEARANNWHYEFAFFDYIRIDGEAEE